MRKKALFAAILALPVSLFSQADTLLTLPTFTLSENRLELPVSEASRQVVIISREQIEALPVQSISEVLQYVAGLDVRQRGVHGVQADISIRGGSFDQTLVLVNGIKLIDPQTGHHLLNIPVPLEAIERIEVLKGPAARIYGQNAFAGAINIVTKTPEEAGLEVALEGGRHETFGGSLNASHTGKNLKQFFSVGKQHSNGYRHNSDYDLSNWFYQNSFTFGNGEASALLGHTERAFGANGFYASPDYTEQYEEVKTTFAALQWSGRQKALSSKYRLSWRRNHDEYIFVRENPSLYHNRHTSHSLTAEAHFSYRSSAGITGAGLEASQMWLSSNNLGDHERLSLTAFLEHRLELFEGMLDLTPGMALAHYPDYGTRAFPGLDAGLALSDELRLFANVGYTWRIPTFTDLYYEDPANEGNPDLQPEEALTWEAGARWQVPGFTLQASWFRRNGKDLIDWVRAADTLRWKPLNYQELNTTGVDLNMSVFFPLFAPRLKALERLSIGYTWIDSELQDPGEGLSRYSLEHLQHQFTAALTYKPLGNLRHTVHCRYADRVSLPAYTVVDTRLSYSFEKIEINLSVNNLFDKSYRESNLVPMPGRWWMVGVKWRG
ncbi:MAG: TonB-dependent receptor [Saprospiraceae bacterium]|nr:MAG: TonB-dependent receptor [Saprospiraceae bacterium]